MAEAITPKGKEIELFNDGFAIKCRFIGGGELPAELSGSWTNKTFALESINKYLERLKTREAKKTKE